MDVLPKIANLIVEKVPLFRSMPKASRLYGKCAAPINQLIDFLKEHPSQLNRDVIRVLEIRSHRLSSIVRSRRRMSVLEIRVIFTDETAGKIWIVVKWLPDSHWEKVISIENVLRAQFKEKLEESGIVVATSAIAMCPLKCTLYRFIQGQDMRVKWRQMMMSRHPEAHSIWKDLSLSAQWLIRFQTHPPLKSSLPVEDRERKAVLGILRKGGGCLLPSEIKAGKLRHLFMEEVQEQAVLSHGTFMLQNVIVESGKPWVMDWENLHCGHLYEDVSAMYMSLVNQGRLFPHKRGLTSAAIREFLAQYFKAKGEINFHYLLVSLMARLIQQLAWGSGKSLNPAWQYYMRWIRRQLRDFFILHQQKNVTGDQFLETII